MARDSEEGKMGGKGGGGEIERESLCVCVWGEG